MCHFRSSAEATILFFWIATAVSLSLLLSLSPLVVQGLLVSQGSLDSTVFLGSQQIQFTSFALVRAYPCSWTSLWYKKFWISKWRIIRHFHFHQPKERCFFNSVGFWLKALAHLLRSTILISTIIISCYNLTIQD